MPDENGFLIKGDEVWVVTREGVHFGRVVRIGSRARVTLGNDKSHFFRCCPRAKTDNGFWWEAKQYDWRVLPRDREPVAYQSVDDAKAEWRERFLDKQRWAITTFFQDQSTPLAAIEEGIDLMKKYKEATSD